MRHFLRAAPLWFALSGGAWAALPSQPPQPAGDVGEIASKDRPMEEALLDILKARRVDAQGIGGYVLLDRKTVFVSVDVFPEKASSWFVVDLEKHRASRGMVGGYGTVKTTIRDRGGNVWLLLQSDNDRPGYNMKSYVAVLPARDSQGNFSFHRIDLADIREGDSNENLCLYFPPRAVLDIAGELAIRNKQANGPNALSFRLQELHCAGLSTRRTVRQFLPLRFGFAAARQASSANRTFEPEWE